MRAYHFLRDDMTAGAGHEPAWTVGETRTVAEAVLCRCGYHSSPSWHAALQYARGAMACIVEISEPVEKEDTKQVSLTRTLVECKDATRTLHLFACECAERVLKAANVTDERSWNAIKVKRLWLDGKATNEEMDAARDAALAAAWRAPWDAARVAARVAAWDAARDAALDAARAAALAAEVTWQRERLDEMMNELFEVQR